MGDPNDRNDERFVEDLYRIVLGRTPREVERDHWVQVLRAGLSDRDVFNRFWQSPEYEKKNAQKVIPGHPVGHYYSPVVDPAEARRHVGTGYPTDPEGIPGITISMARMLDVWRALEPFVKTTSFPFDKEDRYRYYALNNSYPIGDAAILRAMILRARPTQIIEVGAGFSSACMLDTLQEAGLRQTKLTFIEPDPVRLRAILRPSDADQCTLVESQVQSVDPAFFERLAENDILFIDSSHVVKTGSDVNFELFEILPRLKKGVLIHFHDIQYPFEYPDEWIFQKRYSWNEIYALRAFLMYNNTFEIEFFNSLFVRQHRELLREAHAPILKNCGASIWIRKVRA